MRQEGFSLIELLISISLLIIIFGGVYFSYATILDSIVNAELRAEATSVLNRQIEIFRNLPYSSIGTQGGIPSGVIPQEQIITSGRVTFLARTIVRNIDDPFDGTLGGSPNDTAPADYKLVEVEVSCPSCKHFVPLSINTTIAPKNLESATKNGSLFINALNANGNPVVGATVHVINSSTTPVINLTDVTNNSGVLQLVDVPTSTQSYSISVTKSNYSSEQTYRIGDPQNPNPVKPHATVAESTLTQISFAIDEVGEISMNTRDALCAASPNKSFSINGSKIIGTSPNILKFSTTSQTDSNGEKILSNIEWDTYEINYSGSSSELAGITPLSPLTINPGNSINFSFTTQEPQPKSLLTTVKDTSGALINEATLVLTKTGYSKTLVSGRSFANHTNWSSGNYSEQNDTDVDSYPGEIRMVQNGGIYNTSTLATLTSKTFDVGSSTTNYFSLYWLPLTQSPGTNVRFQIASNNDNATWSFTGPDGTGSSYYTTIGEVIHSSHNSHRYIRYKIFMQTANENYTPIINDVSIEFKGICVPQGQSIFNNLASGTYLITASAAGYQTATSSVDVSSDWQQTTIVLSQ